ncbi:uncharacterized protein I206_105531 [Kwoniella pini CBS 10737]|uniref:DNL-type domain-containing protein n=1 Tax=Kwoniella pini CBS 10737 TaxID=1296096 RepID=A0A1B9I3Z9_9TREE|nr:uncharacterized protein I206_03567 [Kwoniella pini CBS 10737]OCF50248.1 hypothetical protein I206_03567 [Kwoniella pini CBS 10737]
MTSIRSSILRQIPSLRSINQIHSQPIASSSKYIIPSFRRFSVIHPVIPCQRKFNTTPKRWNNTSSSNAPQIEAPTGNEGKQKIGQIEPRLQMTFTCTANDCGHRSTHEFSKRSYTNGIVLVQCPECKSRHLIADHIGWFKESLEDGKLKTVEDLLRVKGEKIKKGRINMDGDIEYEGDD